MGRRVQRTDITLRGCPVGEISRWLVYLGLAKALERGTFSTGALLSIMGGPLTGNSEE
jgi:hypothetical protein